MSRSDVAAEELAPNKNKEHADTTSLVDDPEGAFEELSRIEDISERREALKQLIDAWVVVDPDSTMAAIDRIGNLILRRQLHRSASTALAEADPEAAVELLDSVKWSTDVYVRGALRQAFDSWAEADPRAASARAVKMTRRDLRFGAIGQVSAVLVRQSPERALTWAMDLERDEERSSAVDDVLNRAAAQSPRWVIDHLDEASSDRVRAKLAAYAAAKWTETDNAAALAWAESLDDANLRESVMRQITKALFQIDTDAAEEVMLSHLSGDSRRQNIRRLAILRMTGDSDDGIGWIEGLPESDRRNAWHAASGDWAKTDPESAAEFARTAEDPFVTDTLVRALAGSWGESDPERAAEWVQNLEEGESKIRSMASIAQGWIKSDSVSASRWLSSLEPSPGRDKAVAALIEVIQQDDPTAAAEWAQTITDPILRESTNRSILKHLRSH